MGCASSRGTPSLIQSVFLPCQDVIASAPTPPSGLSIVLSRVALPVGQELQTAPSGLSNPALRLFAKQGLLIRRGVPFDLIVAPEWQARLRIGWGNSVTPTVTLRVATCRPPNSPTVNPQDPWLVYAGGYWIDKPSCVLILVRVGQQEQAVKIGLGTPCPNQASSPSPSSYA